MDIVYAVAAGLGVGAAAAFVVAIVQITAKRIRNSILVQRDGGMPIKDVVFTPFYVVFGPIGAVASGVAMAAGASWTVALLTAVALPALLLVVLLIAIATQLLG